MNANILLQPTEEDYLSDSPTPTNVDVDECSNNIVIEDYVARANIATDIVEFIAFT
jgi:hypothetical protein